MSLVPSKTFRENDELVSDLARFSEGILTEKQVRKKWHLFDESAWVAIGEDDLMVEMVEAEQVRRISQRRGEAREGAKFCYECAGCFEWDNGRSETIGQASH